MNNLDKTPAHALGGSQASHRKRTGGPSRVFFATVALIGVLVLLYPTTARWFSSLAEQGKVRGYIESVEDIPDGERAHWLSRAETYNNTLVNGLIVDPFSNTISPEAATLDDAAQEYLDQLSFNSGGVMSRLVIPKINADLPIFHGTTEETLHNGVGHLYGSSLPVGGSGTHAVLVGHSGLPDATLFDDLFDMKIGDTFHTDTLGRTMTYRVFRTDTIEPTDISKLGVEPGRDLVTLVTCTPVGVNSHRLIVQAERIPDPPDRPDFSTPAPVGFPWWALLLGGVLIGWFVILVKAWRDRRQVRTV